MSFRAKIILVSTALSGAVLVLFGLLFLGAIYRVGLERTDNEIRLLGNVQLRRPFPREHWNRFQQSFESLYGGGAGEQAVVKVMTAEGTALHVSEDWPADVAGQLPHVEPPPARRGVFAPPPLDEGPRDPWDPDGERRGPPRRPPHMPPEGPPLRVNGPVFKTLDSQDGRWRVGVMANEHVTLAIALSLESFYDEIGRLRAVFLVGVPLALFLLAAGGWLLSEQALRPVRAIAGTAEHVTARGLDRRIPEARGSREFARLIEVVNRMLDRLERSFGQAVRFSADAAHELKTPLAILQAHLEQAVQDAPPGSPEQQNYSGLQEEVQRLKGIVRNLLLLSRADAGQLMLSREPVNLSALLEDIREDTSILADGLAVRSDLDPGVVVSADKGLLSQALQNLAVNAVKHNVPNGRIELRLDVDARLARVAVSNTTAGISEADRERIFDRFYRGDKTHGREVDGVGLGLSLAREIARAHGGDLVMDPSPNDGVTFTLTLPLDT